MIKNENMTLIATISMVICISWVPAFALSSFIANIYDKNKVKKTENVVVMKVKILFTIFLFALFLPCVLLPLDYYIKNASSEDYYGLIMIILSFIISIIIMSTHYNSVKIILNDYGITKEWSIKFLFFTIFRSVDSMSWSEVIILKHFRYYEFSFIGKTENIYLALFNKEKFFFKKALYYLTDIGLIRINSFCMTNFKEAVEFAFKKLTKNKFEKEALEKFEKMGIDVS